MSGIVAEITDASQLEYQGRPIVVCFTNPLTCAPCKALHPHFGNTAAVFDDNSVLFAEVNVLEHMDIAVEYGVSGTPTILYIGEEGTAVVNSRTTIPLIAEINDLINEA